MPKDSQPDNKRSRLEKANGQTPITRENQNQNRNSKKQSVKNNDV
ncbi:MAG: Glycogen biosynthesis protein GlgD [Clostridium sp.]